MFAINSQKSDHAQARAEVVLRFDKSEANSSLGRRTDCFDSNGQHRIRRGRGCVDDPPVGSGHHGHAHLSSLAFIQTDRRSGRSRTQGNFRAC